MRNHLPPLAIFPFVMPRRFDPATLKALSVYSSQYLVKVSGKSDHVNNGRKELGTICETFGRSLGTVTSRRQWSI